MIREFYFQFASLRNEAPYENKVNLLFPGSWFVFFCSLFCRGDSCKSNCYDVWIHINLLLDEKILILIIIFFSSFKDTMNRCFVVVKSDFRRIHILYFIFLFVLSFPLFLLNYTWGQIFFYEIFAMALWRSIWFLKL